jgi:hypothetical protein
LTRQRFIKLYMGLGGSRNEGNRLAALANQYGETYASRWEYEEHAYHRRKIAARLTAEERAAYAALTMGGGNA